MVQVRVLVSHLAIDLDGLNVVFKRGEVFDCPNDRAARLGNSVEILEAVPLAMPEPEPNPPDTEEPVIVPKKTTPRRRK